jgi:Holliday junction resolvase RusA-like endonuclease
MYQIEEYFTKKGTLSQATVDVDNPIKQCQDILFSVIGTKDSGVADIRALKIPSSETKIVIHLSSHNWKELYD